MIDSPRSPCQPKRDVDLNSNLESCQSSTTNFSLTSIYLFECLFLTCRNVWGHLQSSMESLLSLAFDNLSSRDGGKIRKGLRQVEGLLAQICLSQNRVSAAEKRRSIASPTTTSSVPKDLASLLEDPAFREFFKLQEGFQWNRRSTQGY